MGQQANREIQIFNSALERATPAERAAYLDGACGEDSELRGRVEALIHAHEQAGGFLPAEAAKPKAAAPPRTIAMTTGMFPVTEKAGDRIGHYKLREKIGEGGCGVVYVADQEMPVRRRVALKVIKLGMDTKSVIARFEAERQALAMMDHPNIAKVLDAGATETGRPYFVMELVRGIKITDYCDQNKLSTRERLALFIKVCQAIQHAHQKGIIHRDIKPSNILVTLHDGVPVPKIIDFGISKATEGRLTDLTVYTELHQFIGTPAYMSPEQAEMSGLDIDTRTDIYSLGVLLYELLTGGTPFNAQELVKSGLDAMRKTLRESEPVRPSTRLSTMMDAELTAVAQRHGAESPKLIHLIRGDLDWIVMKSLEKDRTRRYETANGLAMDIQRHLTNEPIVARPPSTVYRFQKMVRRNKLAFVAAGAVILALLAGLSVAAIEWHQTRVERDNALQARAAEEAQRKAAQASEQKARTAEAGQIRLREQAEAQSLAARRRAYAADMNLAQQALAMNNLGRAQTLLNRQKPELGETDLRGWEWRYLWSQTRADEHEVLSAGTNPIYSALSFSADGRLLAFENNGQTMVTDLTSGSTLLQRTNAWHPVFLHHGVRLAFATRVASSTNNVITLLDIATQKETLLTTSAQVPRWICVTPDDRRLLSVSLLPGTEERELTVWDLDTMQPVWQRANTLSKGDYHRPYAISPDGTAIAAAVDDGRVQVFETKDGSERFTIKTTDEYSLVVAFSPDSSTLLTGAGYTDPTIRLWDARNGKATGSLEGHRSFLTDLLFTPDGKLLISSSGDETIRLWDWVTLKPAGILRGHLSEVYGVAIASDGHILASRCKDGSIYLWDVAKPSRHLGYQTLPIRLPSLNAVFTSDSQSILGVESGGGVALWDTRTVKEKRRLWNASTNEIATIISEGARWVAQAEAGGRFRLWDVRSGLESTNFILATNTFPLGFTDKGKFILMLRRDGTNIIGETWESDTWQRKSSIRINSERIAEIHTTSLPNSLVVRTDRAFQFFDMDKPDQAPKAIERRGVSNGLEVSPDGRIAAIAFIDGTVRLWDMGTLQPVATLKGFLLGAHSVTFSPDGQRLAAGSNGQEAVKLWDIETRQEVLTLSGEGSLFYGLSFSPDGRYLLAINSAGLALLWSAPTWDEIAAEKAAKP